MGRKTQKKGRPKAGGGAMDSLEAELSDLFKTLPPIKRAELTKVEITTASCVKRLFSL